MNTDDKIIKNKITEYKPIINDLIDELTYAIEKHPRFATNDHEALSILMEEVGEVAKDVNDKKDSEFIDKELLQVAAVSIRHIKMIRDKKQNEV